MYFFVVFWCQLVLARVCLHPPHSYIPHNHPPGAASHITNVQMRCLVFQSILCAPLILIQKAQQLCLTSVFTSVLSCVKLRLSSLLRCIIIEDPRTMSTRVSIYLGDKQSHTYCKRTKKQHGSVCHLNITLYYRPQIISSLFNTTAMI